MSEKNEFNQILGMKVENWKPKTKPSKSLLPGKYCNVEILDIDKHADELFEVFAQDTQESWTYLPYGPFSSREEYRDWLQQTLDQQDLLYVITDVKTGAIIGIAGYLRITPAYGSIEIGHLNFSRFLKRTPAATEAMYLMMRYAFVELGYRRYEWKCNSLNLASQNAARRFGFTFEGIFRQSHVLKERNRDTAWFSIIDSEWPAIKARFERWLSPENFKSDGNQILSLNEV